MRSALLGDMLSEPAAAIVSGLPLVTKPLKTRVRLIREAFRLMQPGRAVRAVHLCDDAADPEGARRRDAPKPPSGSG